MKFLLDQKLDKRNFRKNISKIDIIKKTKGSSRQIALPLYIYGDDSLYPNV